MSELAVAVVIGAGPAGLAAAKCLSDIGLKPVVLDKEQSVGSVWRRHYERLHLHTPRDLSGLPGLPIPRAAGTYPTRNAVISYFEDYAKAFNITPRFGVEVKNIARQDRRWIVTTSAGKLSTPIVVVATGWASFPNRPLFAGEDAFKGAILHSTAYRNPAPFAGKRVLVVGFGNSGAEIALDLANHGVTAAISLRSAPNILPRELFGISVLRFAIAQRLLPPRFADALNAPLLRLALGDTAGLGFAKPARGALQTIKKEGKIPVLDVGTIAMVRAGKIKVFPGLQRVTAREAQFANGQMAPFDAIILATGFAPDGRKLVPGEPDIFNRHGMPQLGDGPPALPGLYFLGAHTVATGQLRQIATGAARIAHHIQSSRTA